MSHNSSRRYTHFPCKSPRGAICSKCGKEIPFNEGRRYRMKYRCMGCLPETRRKKIRGY